MYLRTVRPARPRGSFAEKWGGPWAGRSIHEITKRDVVEVISAIEQRGAPSAANKALKSIKTFLRWCVGRAILDQSPAEGVPLPAKEVARDRVLNAQELAQVILAARKMGGPYGGIVEFLALTGQRREEVARMKWDELDLAQRIWTLPKSRTKNAKEHVVHLSEQSMAVLQRVREKAALRLLSSRIETLSRVHQGQAEVGSALGCDRMAAA